MSLRAFVARLAARFREKRGIPRGKCVVFGMPHRTPGERGKLAAYDDRVVNANGQPSYRQSAFCRHPAMSAIWDVSRAPQNRRF
jgi:hypothetical protein